MTLLYAHSLCGFITPRFAYSYKSDDQAKIAIIGSESTASVGPYEIGVTAVFAIFRLIFLADDTKKSDYSVNNNQISKIDFDGAVELFQQND